MLAGIRNRCTIIAHFDYSLSGVPLLGRKQSNDVIRCSEVSAKGLPRISRWQRADRLHRVNRPNIRTGRVEIGHSQEEFKTS